MLGNHDYGQQKPTKAEKKRLKKEAARKGKKKKEDDDDGEEDDEDPPPPAPRPSPEQCAAALGASPGASSPPQSQQQCSYGPLPQLGSRLPARDPRWRVSRAFSLRLRSPSDAATGGVSLSGFDTSPLVEKYRKEAWSRVPGGVADQKGAAEAGLLELEASLAREKADGVTWIFAVGHHPFASLASPLRTPELDPLLAGPLRHSSAVFAGHDHTLQFLRWPNPGRDGGKRRPPIIISGGGSDVGGSDAVNNSAVAPGSSFASVGGTDAFFARRRGFADCVVTKRELRCDLIGGDGTVLFSAVVPVGQRGSPPSSPPSTPLPSNPPSPSPSPLPPPQDAETASPPPPHSPPATPVVAEPEEKNERPQAAAEEQQQQQQQQQQQRQEEAAAATEEWASSQQQQQGRTEVDDAAPRPPPVPHLSLRRR